MPRLALPTKGGPETLPEQGQGQCREGNAVMSPADSTPCSQEARVGHVKPWKPEAPNRENEAHAAECIPHLQVGPSSGDGIWEAPTGDLPDPKPWTPKVLHNLQSVPANLAPQPGNINAQRDQHYFKLLLTIKRLAGMIDRSLQKRVRLGVGAGKAEQETHSKASPPPAPRHPGPSRSRSLLRGSGAVRRRSRNSLSPLKSTSFPLVC